MAIEFFRNGIGKLYISTAAGDVILATYDNDESGGEHILQDAIASQPIAAQIGGFGIIEVTNVASNNTITQINVNGINQIGSSVNMVNGDELATAQNMAAGINSFTPVSGADYSAIVDTTDANPKVYLFAPSSFGETVNGHVINITSGAGLTTSITDVAGGTSTNSTKVYDATYGHRYFINAESDAADGVVSGATEISQYIIERTLNGRLDERTYVVVSNSIRPLRVMSIQHIIVENSGSPGSDTLITINPSTFCDNDLIIVRGADPGLPITVQDSTDPSENIFLNGGDFVTADQDTHLILRKYDSSFYEVTRVPAVPNVTIASLRAAGVAQGDDGVDEITVPVSGTVTLVVGTNKKNTRLSGTQTLTGDYTISASTTGVIDGDSFICEHDGIVTLDGNTLSIFGYSLSEAEALTGGVVVTTVYSSEGSAFRTYVVHKADAKTVGTGSIVADAITSVELSSSPSTDADRAVGTDHIKDEAVTPDKVSITIDSAQTLADISFETGEQGAYRVYFNQPVTVTAAISRVTKDIAGTDAATIQFANSIGDMVGGLITHPMSDPFGGQQSITPSTNNTIAAGSYLSMTSAKTTAGGKVSVSIYYTIT